MRNRVCGQCEQSQVQLVKTSSRPFIPRDPVVRSFVERAACTAELTCECGPPSMNERHLNSPGTHCTDLAVPDEIRL